ncbi:hypothetical protein C9426_10015 [Serratia sp. S1B]|nr:hypothetical protein C9426_10015 [Serratia sp. S1B]
MGDVMQKLIVDTGITPTPSQIKIGLEYLDKSMRMIAAVKSRNESQSFINALGARHKGLIYFMAEITRERHKLKFEQLTEHERKAVICAMRDLKELAASLPKRICSSDSIVKNNV